MITRLLFVGYTAVMLALLREYLTAPLEKRALTNAQTRFTIEQEKR